MIKRDVSTRRTARDVIKNEYFIGENKPSAALIKSNEFIEKANKAKDKPTKHENFLNAVNEYMAVESNDLVIAKLYVKLGDTCSDPKKQVEYYKKSLKIHNDFQSKSKTVAKLYYKLGKRDKEAPSAVRRDYLIKAIDMYKNICREDAYTAGTYTVLAELSETKEEKKKHLDDALRIYEKIKVENEETGEAYATMGTVAENDKDKVDKSLKAVNIFHKLNLAAKTGRNTRAHSGRI